MPKYNYVAMDSRGKETKGTLEVASQNEAIARVKDMNLFPTKIVESSRPGDKGQQAKTCGQERGQKGRRDKPQHQDSRPEWPVKSKVLTTFTRQLATLVDAGFAAVARVTRSGEAGTEFQRLRGLLPNSHYRLKAEAIFEALAQHPKVFNRLFVNMVKAGETRRRAGGGLDSAERIHGEGAEDQREGHCGHVFTR